MYFLRLLITILFFQITIGISGQSSPLYIELEDLGLTIPDITIDQHYYLSIKKLADDSIFIALELGDTPMGSKLVFQPHEVLVKSVRQRYETSITVMDEGAHLDLLKWKHYRSPWVILELVATNNFKSVGYSREQSEMFPHVEIEEVRVAVQKSGGERWFEHIKDASDIHTYPFGVGISKVEYLIEYEVSGILKQKYLIFDIPLGC
jgi:hypothetical protein